MVRRYAYSAHVALGAIGALLLSLVCFTGTLATLAPEMDAFATRDLPRVEGAPVRWQAAFDAAEARGGDVRALMVASDRLESRVFREEGERRLYHDPRTGAVLLDEPFRNARWALRDFHRRLLAGRVGHYVVCSSALLLLLSLLSGLLFERRPLRRMRQRGHGARARARSLHVRLGLLSLPFSLVIGGTGVFYLAEGVAEDVGLVRWEPPPVSPTLGEPRPLDAAVRTAQEQLPDLRPTAVWFHETSTVIEGQTQAWLTRDRAQRVVVSRDGTVQETTHARDLAPGARLSAAVDPLHFGTFGGRPTRWLWALFGLALTGLCLTGVDVQLRRLAQQDLRRPAAPPPRLDPA